jgi:hypothetical protein
MRNTLGRAEATEVRAVSSRELQGPPRFVAEHPGIRFMSALGAGLAALLFARRAVRSRRERRFGWSALAVLELVIVAGILSLHSDRDLGPT